MALKRFISAMIGLALFFTIIFLPPCVLGAAIFIIAIIAINEFNSCIEKAGYKAFRIIPYLPSLLIPFTVYAFESGLDTLLSLKIITGASMMFFISAVSVYLLKHKKHEFRDVFAAVFSFIYLAPLFTALIAVRYLDHGIYHIFIAFGGAWVTDTFAYFSGKLFGRRKLIPLISPNKTVAGAIGGVLGTTAVVTVYGHILNSTTYAEKIGLPVFILLGLLLAVFAQFGDLAASAIKRYAGIKDFGKLMPGHGGAIDRFDSVLFSSAVTFVFVITFF